MSVLFEFFGTIVFCDGSEAVEDCKLNVENDSVGVVPSSIS